MNEIMIVLLCSILIVFVILVVLQLQISKKLSTSHLETLQSEITSQQHQSKQEIIDSTVNSVKLLSELISSNQRNAMESQSLRLDAMNHSMQQQQETMKSLLQSLSQVLKENQRQISELQTRELTKINETLTQQAATQENRLKTFEANNEQKLENMRQTIEQRLTSIQQDNNKKLDEMRQTVDEKLQKTLEDKMTQSFQLVNDRLEQVYKGLGEMQTLAVGVGDLKKVLSNVKTRGIVGEIQLGAILEEILSSEQYEVNVETIPGSKNVVEFAIKLPGDGERPVYLPIDSKFPADAYVNLQDAYDQGSSEQVSATFQVLSQRIRSFAKDIRDKYIEVPYTTDFAIMFLPFEGLYAEVVNRGLVEVLQRDYHVNIAGPSTMAALLNSLQMGFRTLAIQKRSSEVWNVLGAVRVEFDKFSTILEATQTRINQANKELDKLVGVRTRAIQRSLKTVEKIDPQKASELLDMTRLDEEEEEALFVSQE